jgi:hypothetical protein
MFANLRDEDKYKRDPNQRPLSFATVSRTDRNVLQKTYPLREMFANLVVSTGVTLSFVDKIGVFDFVNALIFATENTNKQVRPSTRCCTLL